MIIKLDSRSISQNSRPYFIAEISGNHNGKIENAIKLIQEAKYIGADAVKLQTYTPDTMTINSTKDDFVIKEGIWTGYNLYNLYKEAHTPWNWHEHLFEEARRIGITIFSTPFDKTSIELLEKLNAPFYKVASFEITDLELLQNIAMTNKPVILSTGMANESEIEEAINVLESNGSPDIILLHCISGYPTPLHESNLNTICMLQKRFKKFVGLSDHTKTSIAAMTSCALGVKVIEKHIILDRSFGGVDAEFSIEPKQFNKMIKDCNKVYDSLGEGSFELKPSEVKNKIFRRSIYSIKKIRIGEKFTNDNIKVIRPGYGLEPKELSKIIDKGKSKFDLDEGTPISWDHIKF